MDNDAGLSASAVRDASLNEVLPLIKVSGDPWDGRLFVTHDESALNATGLLAELANDELGVRVVPREVAALGYHHESWWPSGRKSFDEAMKAVASMQDPGMQVWGKVWRNSTFYQLQLLVWMHDVLLGPVGKYKFKVLSRDFPTGDRHVIGVGMAPFIGFPFKGAAPAICKPGDVFRYTFSVPSGVAPAITGESFIPYKPSES
ncbi:hypothetical protein HON52_04115 [Candidatus Uhrbacteria bacterium]|nr:hypothetical protein [Candidatus Uhrbacteria bacterium]